MATPGAPEGNQNARKGRLFEQALTREIKQRDLRDGDGETLRKIAAKLVDKATEGDLMAVKDVRDTLDGKPAQAITGADGAPLLPTGFSLVDAAFASDQT
jgi:hypothetical protein